LHIGSVKNQGICLVHYPDCAENTLIRCERWLKGCDSYYFEENFGL